MKACSKNIENDLYVSVLRIISNINSLKERDQKQ